MEQTRQERRATDQVAGGDREAVLVAGAEFAQLGRQELTATTGFSVATAVERAGRGALEVTVVVVERE